MNPYQQKKFDALYDQHINALRRQGKAESTIALYSRSLRRIAEYFDVCPDRLTKEQLKEFFAALVQTHSWSTVRVDRNAFQFFYRHVLGKKWNWVEIVKPPQKTTIPDIFSLNEVEKLINCTRELRYQTFILVTFSMGLRLGETLNLQISDIDAAHHRIHIRQGKGNKDRYVTMPDATYQALRHYWASHRHARFLFPRGRTPELQAVATKVMDRGGTQRSFKAIVKDCGINKAVSIHTLRHTYGACLVEAGLHLRAIQQEMGHESPKTTALYTQLTEITNQNTGKIINGMVDQLSLKLDGEV